MPAAFRHGSGVLFLGESLSAVNWLGVSLVAAGAILVALR